MPLFLGLTFSLVMMNPIPLIIGAVIQWFWGNLFWLTVAFLVVCGLLTI